ncbi:MAG: GlsB/YeaQ/YmgE family stress response membrane protein [Myxococcales bacterium]|nr:GlsB/YeaQ/YmgE family stress response membrane protein [Myxococcales bacterium]
MLSIIVWIVAGLIAGFAVSRLYDEHGSRTMTELSLGVFGGVLGGYVFKLATARDAFDVAEWDAVAAVLGALVVLGIYHGIQRLRRAT